jgi:hypothetical protein
LPRHPLQPDHLDDRSPRYRDVKRYAFTPLPECIRQVLQTRYAPAAAQLERPQTEIEEALWLATIPGLGFAWVA